MIELFEFSFLQRSFSARRLLSSTGEHRLAGKHCKTLTLPHSLDGQFLYSKSTVMHQGPVFYDFQAYDTRSKLLCSRELEWVVMSWTTQRKVVTYTRSAWRQQQVQASRQGKCLFSIYRQTSCIITIVESPSVCCQTTSIARWHLISFYLFTGTCRWKYR